MQFTTRENIVPSRRACRSLFGPVDHEEVKKTLAREMGVLDSRMCAKWNFDFKNGVPLSGKYCWERITPTDDRVPVAYKVMMNRLDDSEEDHTPALEPETLEPELHTPKTTETATQHDSEPSLSTATSRQQENETTPPAKNPVSRKRKSSSQTKIKGELM